MPQKTAKGIPIYVWAGAGLLAVVVGYFFLRSNSSTSTAVATQGAAGACADGSAPNSDGSCNSATNTYAAYLNQSSWLNSELAQISQQLAGIASTQGASAPPNPSPPPPPNPSPCRLSMPFCPPTLAHDGSGILSPAQLQKVA
jgi:hypothetical protein